MNSRQQEIPRPLEGALKVSKAASPKKFAVSVPRCTKQQTQTTKTKTLRLHDSI